jgi:hypothetical protein
MKQLSREEKKKLREEMQVIRKLIIDQEKEHLKRFGPQGEEQKT